MKDKKRHLICWLKSWVLVEFNSMSSKNMVGEKEVHEWGWQTACGDVFWPTWKGTTNKKDVTCKKCLKYCRS